MKEILRIISKRYSKRNFKKQQVNVTNISSNFTLTIKEIKSKGSLKQEVNNLKKSTEFTKNDLEEKFADVE